jgi:hypothetical protein
MILGSLKVLEGEQLLHLGCLGRVISGGPGFSGFILLVYEIPGLDQMASVA